MSAKKGDIEFNEEEKVNINQEKNNSQIIRYSKNFVKNLRFENINKESNRQKNSLQKNDNIEKIKQKLKENLDNNLNSYIFSTKAKE